MPKRRSARVVLTRADLSKTAAALLERVPMVEETIPEEPESIEDVLSKLGKTRREQIRRGAIALSGSADTKSRAYLSARRRLERYTTTKGEERRRARPKALQEIARTIRRPHLDVRQELTVQMLADVIYAGQQKTMPAHGAQLIRARYLAPVRARLRDGAESEAALELLGAFVLEYGLNTEPDARGVIGNIEWIEIEVAEQ